MLMEILEKGSYSHLVIRDVLDKYDYMKQPSKAFMKRVTEGTLERLLTIDYVLDSFSKTPVTKMKPLIRNLLRMSVYQLLYMDQIPDRAVCDEAVKLAGKRGFKTLQGFVNGVLRNISRNKDSIAYPEEKDDPVRAYAIRYSMPKWLVSQFFEEQGRERTKEIFENFEQIQPVTLRYCGSAAGKEAWMKQAAERGFCITEHPYLPYACLVESGESLRELPGYEEGLFTVQDVSSMLVTEAAGLKGDEFVLDVCAAPGGKSLHAAQILPDGRVLARDLTEYKTGLIEENKRRLRCSNLDVQVWDACRFDEAMKGQADVVYADLPCSGLGILGKKRDIRYRMTKEQEQELVALQKQILSVVWQYVKPGGVLIYSTCTIHTTENGQMAEWFTKEFPFVRESFAGLLPKELKPYEQDGMLQLFPKVGRNDGFFIAKMRRIQE